MGKADLFTQFVGKLHVNGLQAGVGFEETNNTNVRLANEIGEGLDGGELDRARSNLSPHVLDNAICGKEDRF